MNEKYKIIVDMYESHDVEGKYSWKIEDNSGYAVRDGLANTPPIAFGEAIEAFEKLKNQ